MRRKRGRKRKQRKKPETDPSSRRRGLAWGVVGVLAVAVIVYALGRREDVDSGSVGVEREVAPTEIEREVASTARDVPPFHRDPNGALPFPETLSPTRYRMPFVSRAYQIAREIPAVLAQQPCYCYCEGFGHGSLLDCYASDHGAG
jgi:hypothetical protein